MELLDRYLQAVKKHLPWQRQDDIIAELRANLESQLEDREYETGRPLTTAEVEAWLKQMGSPMQVASRYQPQQYLIGPAVFPTYWFVLRTALFWVAVVYLIGVAVQFGVRSPSLSWVLGAVLRVPVVFMTTAAWVTLIFAAIELIVTHYPAKWPEVACHFSDWSPRSLPPLEKQVPPGKKPRSYAHAVAEVVFGLFFLIWLLLIPQHPYLLLGPGAPYIHLWGPSVSAFELAPVWVQFYWWVVALNVVQWGWRCLDLVRGSWQQPHIVQQLTMKVFGLIPLGLLLSVQDRIYVTLRNPAQDEGQYGASVASINYWSYRVLLLVCAIAILQLLWEIAQASLDAYRKRAVVMR